jgi:hypothetical protein
MRLTILRWLETCVSRLEQSYVRNRLFQNRPSTDGNVAGLTQKTESNGALEQAQPLAIRHFFCSILPLSRCITRWVRLAAQGFLRAPIRVAERVCLISATLEDRMAGADLY